MYRIVAFALIGLGLFQILETLGLDFEITKEKVELSGMGLASIFLGLLNLAYVYEIPESKVPKIVLLSSNLLFIGYSILSISTQVIEIYGYIAIVLSVINCIMVLNHKV